ncbi:hypothetical protein [Zunongwangia sp. HGR-M22]|uniref:hypothetical protein n=1 Tax=Zunongwangia sp. HGR-M22 TaxID=3015168 RepID=UPI0022DD0795|nr:hypothetical protein [Zunongwangia sp. HGR-M22]WBL26233.1 hypothetical protein PBT91_02850 [Zunongwangia sp. HGR-M22]
MAPIKFEEHVKERLEERRISPSEGSWEKLNARLDKNENQQKSNKKWWLGIAALLVIAISIGGFMLKSESEDVAPQIVEKPSEKEVEPQQNFRITSEEKNDEIRIAAEETKAKPEKTNKANEPEIVQYKSDQISEKLPVKMQEIQVAETELEIPEKTEVTPKIDKINPNFINPSKAENDYIAHNEKLIQQKLEEVIRSLHINMEDSVTDAEVNALLLAAASDLDQDYKKEYTNKYSAEALLVEAEREIEKSFRDKIFDLLKEGYSKAKNAVALD